MSLETIVFIDTGSCSGTYGLDSNGSQLYMGCRQLGQQPSFTTAEPDASAEYFYLILLCVSCMLLW